MKLKIRADKPIVPVFSTHNTVGRAKCKPGVDRKQKDTAVTSFDSLLSAARSGATDPEIDLERLGSIKAMIMAGNYHVPADKIADAILEHADWVDQWLN